MEFEELSETRLKQLRAMPIIETRISKSKDSRYVIHRTQIVDIKPVEYWEKVFDEE